MVVDVVAVVAIAAVPETRNNTKTWWWSWRARKRTGSGGAWCAWCFVGGNDNQNTERKYYIPYYLKRGKTQHMWRMRKQIIYSTYNVP